MHTRIKKVRLIAKNNEAKEQEETEEVVKPSSSYEFMNFGVKKEKKNPFYKKEGKEEKKDTKTEDKKEDKKEKVEDDDFKAKYEALKRYESEEFSKLISYIEENYEGETLSEKFQNFTEFEGRAKEALPKVEEYERKTKEFDERMRAIDIRQTSEWQKNYERPAQIAKDAFIATISDVDAEGKIRHEKQVEKLAHALFNEGKELSGPQARAIIKQYAEQYEKATGEEYEAPSLTQVLKAREELVKAVTDRNEAFANWEKIQEEESKKKLVKTQKEQEEILQAEKKERQSAISSLKSDFDFSNVSAFFKKEDIEAEIDAVHKLAEEMIAGTTAIRTYDKVVEDAVKARLFDKLLEQAKTDRNFVEEYKDIKNENHERKPGERTTTPKPGEKGSKFFQI